MRPQPHLILIKNVFREKLKLSFLMGLTLYCFSTRQAQSDSTFFPEDSVEAKTDKAPEENSDAIKKWAELPTPKKRTAAPIPPDNQKTAKVILTQPETPTPEKLAQPKPASIATVTPISDGKESLEPLQIATTVPTSTESAVDVRPVPTAIESVVDVKPVPTAIEPLEQKPAPLARQIPDVKSPASPQQQPLELTTVTPRPKALPVHEKSHAALSAKEQETIVAYSDAANNRPPLGILEPNQEIHHQRWYIYSSAIRGLKNPSDGIQIVSLETGTTPSRGVEVKDLLVDMGIDSEKIKLIRAKGEENQTGTIYIFSEPLQMVSKL